jgi:cytochrome b subunit of formate dehydrogenase
MAIAPSMLDVRQAVQNLAFYTWRRKEHVDFRRYDYTQKAEYWALIWGTLVMAVTGFILWFPGTAVRFLPTWAVTAAQTVHYYEAWLATLAILVWHFFFVVFHPEVYPMSWIWISGKMNAQAASRHHPQWCREELAKAEARQLETKRADVDQASEESA